MGSLAGRERRSARVGGGWRAFHRRRTVDRGGSIPRCLLLGVLLLVGACGAETPPGRVTSIPLGDPVVVLEEMVPVDGAVLRVEQRGHPLDGLTVEVPQGAYPEPVRFSIRARPVGVRGSDADGVPLAPAIDIEGPAGRARSPIVLTIPVAVPDGHVAMAFRLDEPTGRVEALPLLAQDATSVTACTDHFSPVLVESIATARLETGSIRCGFDPTRDYWHLENRATFVNPLGMCDGLCATAIWYDARRRSKGGPRLFGRFDNDRRPGTPTPGVWQDDVRALTFVSAVQAHEYKYLEDAYPLWERLHRESKGGRPLVGGPLQRYAAAFGIQRSKSPVLIGVRTADLVDQHMLLCHEVVPGALHVLDPNVPEDRDRLIRLVPQDGKTAPPRFEAYRTGRNTKETKSGRKKAYTQVLCLGSLPAYRASQIAEYWEASADRHPATGPFPPYALFSVARDEAGRETGRARIDPAHEVDPRSLELAVEAPPVEIRGAMRFVTDAAPGGATLPFRGRVRICRQAAPGSFHDGPIELRDGTNVLGCLVEGRLGDGWFWAGFDWIRVAYEEGRGAISFSDADVRALLAAVQPTLPPGEIDTSSEFSNDPVYSDLHLNTYWVRKIPTSDEPGSESGAIVDESASVEIHAYAGEEEARRWLRNYAQLPEELEARAWAAVEAEPTTRTYHRTDLRGWDWSYRVSADEVEASCWERMRRGQYLDEPPGVRLARLEVRHVRRHRGCVIRVREVRFALVPEGTPTEPPPARSARAAETAAGAVIDRK